MVSESSAYACFNPSLGQNIMVVGPCGRRVSSSHHRQEAEGETGNAGTRYKMPARTHPPPVRFHLLKFT
jgi:hypothetical protein